MEKFIARIEFEFEASALTDGGWRFRELSAVDEAAGFTMIRGEVHPAAESQESPERPGWIEYGPKVDPGVLSTRGSFRNTGPGECA